MIKISSLHKSFVVFVINEEILDHFLKNALGFTN